MQENGDQEFFLRMAKDELKLSDEIIQRLIEFSKRLVEWNQQINLISRKNESEVLIQHVLHSLSILKAIQFRPGEQILDIGTGGGLPGIPLAIVFPETTFYLVDSIAKKIKVVQDISDQMKLKNVVILNKRVEELDTKFDFILSRAVAPTKKLLHWTNKKLINRQKKSNVYRYYLLKGGDLKEELKETKKRHKVWKIHEFFPDPFFETKCIVGI